MAEINRLSKIILVIGVFFFSHAHASESGAKSFVQHLTSEAIEVVTNEALTNEAKTNALTNLFEDAVDTKWIAKFTAGRYWRGTKPELQKKYVKAYHDYLIGTYIPRFKNYNDEKSVIKNVSTKDDGDYVVHTEIISKDSAPIVIDYLVRKNATTKAYKINDIIAEGISLITTQRSEFQSILSRSSIKVLTKKLKAKAKAERKKLAENS